MSGLKLELKGLQQTLRAVEGLKKHLQTRVFKKAVGSAIKPMVKVARSKVPVKYGILKRSLGAKVKGYKAGAVVGVVGARKGFKTPVKAVGSSGVLYADPVHYSHLVEFGTSHSAAQPFLRPTYTATVAEAEKIVARVTKDEIKKVLAKYGSKARA